MKRFILFLMSCFFILSLVGSFLIYLLFLYYSQDLPDYKQLEVYDPPVVTRLYANDGQLFHEYAKEKRVFLPIIQIPQHIINTFLAAEDRNFYSHQGIDAMGVVRACLSNIRNFAQGRRLKGASTITQQVAKNFLIGNEVSIARKIKEAILAFRLEKTFNKEKILELYLNEIYLGGGAYGVGAAAIYYFAKSLDELTIAEAAYLAALPKAPNSYHPLKHAQKALARRNWVIERMVENGIIHPEQGLEAQKEPLKTRFQERETAIVTADFFAEEVRRDLVKRFGLDELYKGGFTVKTTLDPRLQSIADDVLRNAFIAYDRRYGWRGSFKTISIESWKETLKNLENPKGLAPFLLAVVLNVTKDKAVIGLKDGSTGEIPLKELLWARVHMLTKEGHPYVGPLIKKPSDVLKVGDVIAVSRAEGGTFSLQQIPDVGGALVALDPHTGRVLAMVGGYSFEVSEFNRATQALRQPGSTFKVFVYLRALERGLTPILHIMDEPVEIDIGWGLGKWSPKNIYKKFYGEVTLRRAFEKSHNASTVQLAKVLGIQDIVDCAIRLGLYDTLSPHWAAVLGTGETTLLKLTTAFGMIANGGKKITPIFIERIQDRRGKTVYRSDSRPLPFLEKKDIPSLLPDLRESVSDPASIYQLISLLEGVVERGSGTRARVEGYPLAGKSGTSSDFRDAWFIEFSPNLVVGVFMGFDAARSLGNHQEGGKLIAPIAGEFMRRALKGTAPVPFKRPRGLKFKKINLDTGELASPHDKNSILEGFKPGTEPIPGQPKEPPIGRAGSAKNLLSTGAVVDPAFFQTLEAALLEETSPGSSFHNSKGQEEKNISSSLEEASSLKNSLQEGEAEGYEDIPFELPPKLNATSAEAVSSHTVPVDLSPAPPPFPPSQKISESTGTGGLF